MWSASTTSAARASSGSRGQGRDPVDAAFLSLIRRQRGPASASRASGQDNDLGIMRDPSNQHISAQRCRAPVLLGCGAFPRRQAEGRSVRQPTDKPPAKPTDLLTRRVIARAKAARVIAEPVAILGDPAPGRSALEQRARAEFVVMKKLGLGGPSCREPTSARLLPVKAQPATVSRSGKPEPSA